MFIACVGLIGLVLPATFYTIPSGQVGVLATSKYQRADGRVYDRPETSSTDAGLVLGGAYHFTENLALAAHYYHGMQNLNPDRWNSTLYNRVFQLSIEYIFNSKK